MKLHELSVKALSKLIRTREISVTETVRYFIDRIEQVNPKLNALVASRFEQALEEAKEMDGSPKELPLFGIPFTTKEMICVKGMPNTCGSPLRINEIAKKDAISIARLRKSGAIPLGVSNIPEWAFWTESSNLVYGRTNNPHDLSRTPGGSSGGEAALISAGLTGFGVGSDTAGSIRQPSGFCGIFGHRPSRNLVPITGHLEGLGGPQRSSISIGPMCRHAEDLDLILRPMMGPDGQDPVVENHRLTETKTIDLKGMKFFTLFDPELNFADAVSEDILLNLNQTKDHLIACGARHHVLDKDLFKDAFKMWATNLRDLSSLDVRHMAGNGRPINPFVELARGIVGKRNHIWPIILFALGESLGIDRWNYDHYRKMIRIIRAKINETLGDRAFLLFPLSATNAPKHGHPMLTPFRFVYTGVFNAIDLPVTVAPLGLDKDGLPNSVQIVGATQNDAFTISVAKTFEQLFGGWIPPKISQLAYNESRRSPTQSRPLEL